MSGVVSADYSNINLNSGGGSANLWGVNAGGMFDLAPDWAAQIDGGYHHIDVNGGGGSGNDWNIDGSAFWRASAGRVGALVGYNSVDSGGGSLKVTNYGLFGDWYAGHAFTLGVKGGAFNASHGVDGEYVGVGLTGYVSPDFALMGSYDYSHFKHLTNENDYTIQGEWLFSESTPVSVYGGYTRSEFSGSGGASADTWFIGIRLYCDPAGGALIDRQRNGAEIYGTSFGPAALHF